MKRQVTKLDNGLNVMTIGMKDAKSVTASIVVGVGSRSEDDSVNGVSHFLEHLLFKGSKKRPSAKIISQEVDAVGGWNNAYTSNDVTNYFIKVPANYSSLALDILADMIKNPLIDPEEVDRERSVVLEEMNVIRDDPARSVGSLLPPLLWPNDPLGNEVIGTERVIKNIKRDRIVEYMKSHYVPGNMAVSVAGRVNHNEVVDQVKAMLGDMESSSTKKHEKANGNLSEKLVKSTIKDTAQAHFVIGCKAYPYLHKDDAAAKVVTYILGRGMSSRLFINVRERKGLAYHVASDIHNFIDTGVFDVYAGVNLDRLPLAIEAVLEELNKITEQPVSPMELAKAQNQIRGGYLMALENNVKAAEIYGLQLALLGKTYEIEDYLRQIDAVTVGDVKRVANQMLARENLRMGIIAPESEVRAAKKKFKELVS